MIETFEDKDEIFIKYLLDELPPHETKELEDEMLQDNELFDQLQVVEMALIDSYVRKEMAAREKIRFEQRFLILPENKYKVEEAQIFQESLQNWFREQAATQPIKGKERWGTWFPTFFILPMPWAVAALLLLFVLMPLGLKWAYPYKITEAKASDHNNSSEVAAYMAKLNQTYAKEQIGDKDHNQ